MLNYAHKFNRSLEMARCLNFGWIVLAACGVAAAQAPPASAPDAAADSAKAHTILESGRKGNGLVGEGIGAWHVKVEFTWQEEGQAKLTTGTMEEWATGPFAWKRVYTSNVEKYNGTEWSTAKLARSEAHTKRQEFAHRTLELKVARPVVDPLFLAQYVKPEYELTLKRLNSGAGLSCLWVTNPKQYAGDEDADQLFPKWCLDDTNRLRLTSAGDQVTQFANFEAFQGRPMARDVKVVVAKNLSLELKVTLLEPLAAEAAEMVKPAANAVFEPYERELGDPKPVPVYQAAAAVPLTADHRPYLQTDWVPVVIQKDGSVKIIPKEGGPEYDAIVLAVKKWRYQPYMMDGQPVELSMSVEYVMDGKPWIPEYKRKKESK